MLTDNLTQAAQIRHPAVDARLFILDPGPTGTSDQDFQVSGVLIYLLNMLIKLAIRQWVSSAATTKFNAAEPYGVLLAHVFSSPKFKWHGHSFADIILAKMHVACPVVFGIYGPEMKEHGRARLGWRKIDGEWVPSSVHYERMKGIGAGWASLTLRNFTRARISSGLQNPLPAWHFWRSISCIVNTPPDQATATHFIVLKAMLHNDYVKSFVAFYGQAAAIALRKAVVEFPASVEKSEASQAVAVLRDTLKKELQLEL
jgi:nucleoporin GLE1